MFGPTVPSVPWMVSLGEGMVETIPVKGKLSVDIAEPYPSEKVIRGLKQRQSGVKSRMYRNETLIDDELWPRAYPVQPSFDVLVLEEITTYGLGR